jgi:hypothetical protein
MHDAGLGAGVGVGVAVGDGVAVAVGVGVGALSGARRTAASGATTSMPAAARPKKININPAANARELRTCVTPRRDGR